MTPRIARLISRLSALALLVFVLWGSWILLVVPVADALRVNDDETASSMKLLAAFSRNASVQPALHDAVAKLRETMASQPGFLPGTDPNIVAAKLQSDVKHLVEAGKGEVRSVQLLPATDVEGFRKIAVRVEFLTDAEGLQRIFYDIETANPDLFLDGINLRGSDAAGMDEAAIRSLKLTIRCDVYGFLRASS